MGRVQGTCFSLALSVKIQKEYELRIMKNVIVLAFIINYVVSAFPLISLSFYL